MAEVIANKLRGAKEPDWSKLNLTDQRRAAKLRFLRMLGLPYHFNPLLPVKSRLLGARYAIKTFAYRKSIHPRDVEAARRWLEQGLAKNKAADR